MEEEATAVFFFSRFITKKVPIDQYGKLGFRLHKEGVLLIAHSLEEAKEMIKPYNKKKHIKFKFECICVGIEKEEGVLYNTILDLGQIDED